MVISSLFAAPMEDTESGGRDNTIDSLSKQPPPLLDSSLDNKSATIKSSDHLWWASCYYVANKVLRFQTNGLHGSVCQIFATACFWKRGARLIIHFESFITVGRARW